MFSKAKTKRFNEVEGCAPAPGSYNPSLPKSGGGPVSFIKSDRFLESSFKVPGPPPLDSSNATMMSHRLSVMPKLGVHKSVPNLSTTKGRRMARPMNPITKEKVVEMKNKIRFLEKKLEAVLNEVKERDEKFDNNLTSTPMASSRHNDMTPRGIESSFDLSTCCNTPSQQRNNLQTEMELRSALVDICKFTEPYFSISINQEEINMMGDDGVVVQELNGKIMDLQIKLKKANEELEHEHSKHLELEKLAEKYMNELEHEKHHSVLLASENKKISLTLHEKCKEHAHKLELKDKELHDITVEFNELKSSECKLMKEYEEYRMNVENENKLNEEKITELKIEKQNLTEQVATYKKESSLLQEVIEDFEKDIEKLKYDNIQLSNDKVSTANAISNLTERLDNKEIERMDVTEECEKLQADINLLTINLGVLEQKKISLEEENENQYEERTRLESEVTQLKNEVAKLRQIGDINRQIKEQIEILKSEVQNALLKNNDLKDKYKNTETEREKYKKEANRLLDELRNEKKLHSEDKTKSTTEITNLKEELRITHERMGHHNSSINQANLEIGRLNLLLKTMQDQLNEKKKEKALINLELHDAKDKFEIQSEELNHVKREASKMQSTLTSVGNANMQLGDTVSELENHNMSLIKNIQRQREALELSFREKRNLLGELKKANVTVTQYEEVKNELDRKASDHLNTISELMQELKVYEEKNESHMKVIEECESIAHKLKVDNEMKTLLLKQCEDQTASYKVEVANLEQKLDENLLYINQMNDKFLESEKNREAYASTLNQEINQLKNHIQSIEVEKETSTNQLKELQSKLEFTETQLQSAVKDGASWRIQELEYRETISKLNDSLEQAQLEAESSKDVLRRDRPLIDEFKKRLKALESLKEQNDDLAKHIAKLEAEKEQLSDKLTAKQVEMKSLVDVLEPFQDALQALNQAEKKNATLAEQVAHLIGHNNLKQRIKYVENLQKQKAASDEDCRRLLNENRSLKLQLMNAERSNSRSTLTGKKATVDKKEDKENAKPITLSSTVKNKTTAAAQLRSPSQKTNKPKCQLEIPF